MLIRSFEEKTALRIRQNGPPKSATFTGKTLSEKTKNTILFGEPDKQAHPVVNKSSRPRTLQGLH